MTISPWFTYAAGFAGIGVVSRLWVKFRRDRAARRDYSLPLFDPETLNTLFKPEPLSGDDRDVLAEMRGTLAHLNRSVYAEEFWSLDKQLTAYYAKLPKASRPTMRRALIRMLLENNRWLQIVAAKTCASIGLPEAIKPLLSILDTNIPTSSSDSILISPHAGSADVRFRDQIEAAFNTLQLAVKS